MFDFVQEKRKLVQIVLALIILPFALWGVDSYRHSGGPQPLAEVDGEKIGAQEFENALEQQRQRIREMAGPSFDQSIFDKPEIRHSILERLVTQRLMFAQARNLGLMPNDEQIAQVIVGIDVFHKDGKFDKQQYVAALRERGMSQKEFESKLAQDIAVQQLTGTYTQNGYAAETVAAALIRLNEQQRAIAIARLDADAFLKQAGVSDKEVSEYYGNNASEFQLPERATVEYVVFSADSLMPTIAVSEDEIKRYYDEHQAEYGTQEQRQAAHILIAVAKQAPEADRNAARTKAEQVLQQVRQSPGNFASLAKQYSQDPGSAPNGGDLGMFARGAMVKPFEDSVFNLKPGEISGLVQTDYGYHIIKLLAVKQAKVQALSAVRDTIRQRLKSQAAADKFAELAEKFNNTVYEQSDSLKPAADLVHAAIQRGMTLSRGQAPSGLWTAKVLEAVFSDDVAKNKRNSAAIEVAPNTLIAARVLELLPARARPLQEVAAGIKQKLQKQRATEMAIQQGKAALEKLQRGEKAGITWKAVQTITRNQRDGIDPGLVQAVFRADTSKLPAYVGVADGQGGFVMARIDAVKEAAKIDQAKLNRYAQQIRQLTGEELLMAYMADTKKNASIKMKDFTAEAGK